MAIKLDKDGYSIGKCEVFSAGKYSKDMKRHTHFRFWRDEDKEWIFIKTVTDVHAAFSSVTEFSIPKEIISVIVRETAKEKLKK